MTAEGVPSAVVSQEQQLKDKTERSTRSSDLANSLGPCAIQARFERVQQG